MATKKPSLLVINPNTTEAVTRRLVEAVIDECGTECMVHGFTARFGARYIADETSYAIASHAVLDAWAVHCDRRGVPDAVLIGCFGDPGLWALRECSPRPVIGLAEAAMQEAAARGRFAIVTGGAAWEPMLRRLALAMGLGEALARLEVLAPSGADLAADAPAAIRLLREACVKAAAPGDVQCVVLGGAGLAGLAQEVEHGLVLPLIDSVAAGARALVAAAMHPAKPRMAVGTKRSSGPWAGLTVELAQWLS